MANRSRHLAPVVAACCLAWASVLAQDGRPALRQLPPAINSLLTELGEGQIGYLEGLWRIGGGAASNAEQLQGFRKRVAAAVMVHPDVLAASAARGALTSAIREAEAARWPQVSAQLENGRRTNDPNSLLNTPARDYSSAAFTVTVRQLMYDFGASRGAIASSTARDLQGFYRLQLSSSEVALRAIQAFHDLVRAQRQFDFAIRNEQARGSIVDLVKQRNDLGGGTRSDMVRAQSRMAEASAMTASARQRLGLAQAAYREIFNADPGAVGAAEQLVFAIDLENDFQARLSQAGQDSWKVRIAQSARDAALAEMQNAKARALPAINLELSNSRRDLVGPGTPGTDRSVMLVARQTLFGGGADTARIDQAAQKLKQAEEELESAQRESTRVLEQAFLEAESMALMVNTRADSARLAADSLRMVREQYAYRRGTLLDLLTAQESLYSAGRELIDAQVDQAVSRFKVLHTASLLNRFLDLQVPRSR